MSLPAKISGNQAPRSDLLGFLLVDAARLLRAAFEQRISDAGLGLTAGEARALINIADHEGNRQLDIASRMGVEPMTLCAYLDRLQAMGLIERQKCAADRRAKRIVLTASSEAMIRRIRREFQAVLDQATPGMTPDERHMLETSLSALNRNLQACLPSTSPLNEIR
jgi:MarR family transcriptional regulator, transcriptional regulator for hemolysin